MQTRPAASRKSYRLVSALSALVIAGIMGALLIALAGSHATPSSSGKNGLYSTSPTATLTKIQEGNAMAATELAMAQTYGPLKKVTPLSITPAPTPTSCPMALAQQNGISPYRGGDDSIHDVIVNTATIAPTPAHPFQYLILAGARRSNSPQVQGAIYVYTTPEDPCTAGNWGSENVYETPYQRGALTITQINGDSITFSIADGGIGHFNYVTGQFW
jgi:hypothetical protein